MSIACPYCSSPMESGLAEIDGSLLGLWSSNFHVLYFRDENENKLRIMDSNELMPALRCSHCGIFILNKTEDDSGSVSEEEFTVMTRDNIISILRLWSSYELQVEYRAAYPELSVVAELFDRWNDFYNIGSQDFKDLFSDRELKELEAFDEELRRVSGHIHKDFLSFEEFIRQKEWQDLKDLADRILRKLGS